MKTSPRTIAGWEKGERAPSANEFRAALDVLGVDVAAVTREGDLGGAA